MSFEQKSLERANSFIDFIKEHERFPSVKTKNDPHEHKLAVWIVQIRRSKRGTSDPSRNMVLYESVESLLDEHVPNWLDGAGQQLGNRIHHCELKTKKIIKFVQDYNRFPVATIGTPNEERVLAHFLNRLRMAKKGSSKFVVVLHPSIEKMLDDAVPFWKDAKYFKTKMKLK